MAYVVYLIQALAYLMKVAILARALISWVRADPYNPLVRFLGRVTEPVLRPLRQVLPTWRGVDMSPVVALVIIQLAEWLLLRLVLLG
jgi:YggT family protein